MKFNVIIFTLILLFSCKTETNKQTVKEINHSLEKEIIISRDTYYNQLYGFWLGQCIANWTGLVTEMEK